MYWRFWLANLGTTALFIAIHWPGWLVQPLPYSAMLLNSLSTGVFSIFWGVSCTCNAQLALTHLCSCAQQPPHRAWLAVNFFVKTPFNLALVAPFYPLFFLNEVSLTRNRFYAVQQPNHYFCVSYSIRLIP